MHSASVYIVGELMDSSLQASPNCSLVMDAQMDCVKADDDLRQNHIPGTVCANADSLWTLGPSPILC